MRLQRRTSCIVPLQNGAFGLPLFLIHGADGDAFRFSALAKHMSDRPIFGVCWQALVQRARAMMHVEEQAAYYVEQIRRVQPRGPYHLVGYSYGGLVALEMAQLLESQGQKCALLGAVDSLRMTADSPAGVPEASVKTRSGVALAAHLMKVIQPEGMFYVWEKLSGRTLRLTYTILDRTGVPIPAFLKRPYHINWFAAVHYTPQPYSGRVTLFQSSSSTQDGRVSNSMWAGIARGGIEVRELPGTHETLFFEPNVAALAREIEAVLSQLD